jgi:hypothetical protein
VKLEATEEPKSLIVTLYEALDPVLTTIEPTTDDTSTTTTTTTPATTLTDGHLTFQQPTISKSSESTTNSEQIPKSTSHASTTTSAVTTKTTTASVGRACSAQDAFEWKHESNEDLLLFFAKLEVSFSKLVRSEVIGTHMVLSLRLMLNTAPELLLKHVLQPPGLLRSFS